MNFVITVMEKARTEEYKKGLWTDEEDKILREHIKVHGKGKWNRVSQLTGLKRCGKSCRLRWINYLSPTVKRGHFSEQEDDLIIRLHKLLGNRWSLIAGRVPGRTDNQVKNHWNSHLSRRLGIRRENNSRDLSKKKKYNSRVIRVLSSPPSPPPSSQVVPLPIKEKEHLDNPSTESPSKPPFNDINNGGSDDQKASEDGSLDTVEDLSVQELWRSEDNDSSFRFFSDYYMSQDFCNLMEFL